MKFLKTLFLGVAASTVLASGASAADVPVVMPAPVISPPVVVADAGFDWNGFFVGTAGGAVLQDWALDGYLLTGVAGFNLAPDRLLLGARVRAGTDFYSFPVEAEGRVGFAGARVLAFVAAGAGGYATDFLGTFYYYAGGGVEVAIGRRLSLTLDARGQRLAGGPSFYSTFLGGVNFHLGN